MKVSITERVLGKEGARIFLIYWIALFTAVLTYLIILGITRL